ncbi:MAG: thioredoxin family protein [Oscillospiraceae bacterium]|nr:thioredoxin family protein [Oscillospiraceae bacterium]
MIQMNRELFQICTSGSSVPVLVAFCSAECGYCRRLQPALKRVSGRWGDRLLVGQVNIDRDYMLAMEERIEVVPTLVLYDRGKALGSIVVPNHGDHIDDFLKEALAEA